MRTIVIHFRLYIQNLRSKLTFDPGNHCMRRHVVIALFTGSTAVTVI